MIGFLVLTLLPIMAQDSDALIARRLFYEDNTPATVFKATTVAAKPVVVAPAPKPRPLVTPVQKIEDALREVSKTSLNGPAPVKPVSHIGVRYNILKVDLESQKATEVAPDTVFHKGDCVRIRMQPNRGGFLYVFAQGSSGTWQTLLPSEEAFDETNLVGAYNLTDVPAKTCFEFDNTPGVERLMVVVTSKPEDVLQLNESIRKPDPIMVAGLATGLQSRDLKITRVDKPKAAGEAPYSTYLVNAASTTSDRLVIEIKLKHEELR